MATSSKRKTTAAPRAIGVRKVGTSRLIPNPHNPRLLFDKEPLADLRGSIKQSGILVPLTVYRQSVDGQFVILDGQRRWICAQELGLRTVPVNEVAEPTTVQNIVTMFQIHKLREDWQLMPTALTIDVLMDEIGDRNEGRLAVITGLDRAMVSRCKKLLTFEKQYQDMMLDPDPSKRVKSDFFIELYAVRNDRFVNKMNWYNKKQFTERMLFKYQNKKGLKAVTDFRVIKQHLANARRARKDRTISKRLREFTGDDTLGLDHLALPEADISASARKLISSVQKLQSALSQLDVDEYYGEKELWKALEKLLKTIRSTLRAAGFRPTG